MLLYVQKSLYSALYCKFNTNSHSETCPCQTDPMTNDHVLQQCSLQNRPRQASCPDKLPLRQTTAATGILYDKVLLNGRFIFCNIKTCTQSIQLVWNKSYNNYDPLKN